MMPEDPFGPLQEGAVQLHELFRSYVDAGFSEEQAMRLVEVFQQGILNGIMAQSAMDRLLGRADL
jgi:hypothetical protein